MNIAHRVTVCMIHLIFLQNGVFNCCHFCIKLSTYCFSEFSLFPISKYHSHSHILSLTHNYFLLLLLLEPSNFYGVIKYLQHPVSSVGFQLPTECPGFLCLLFFYPILSNIPFIWRGGRNYWMWDLRFSWQWRCWCLASGL
jgi:hypothetical protein